MCLNSNIFVWRLAEVGTLVKVENTLRNYLGLCFIHGVIVSKEISGINGLKPQQVLQTTDLKINLLMQINFFLLTRKGSISAGWRTCNLSICICAAPWPRSAFATTSVSLCRIRSNGPCSSSGRIRSIWNNTIMAGMGQSEQYNHCKYWSI